MAGAISHEASSSRFRCPYHVFLSFRGEDTRKNFTDHLYTALVQAGFRTFRDDDEIQRGKEIQLEIQKAIKESRMSVIVFSKDYASSRWCLDELVMIMKRKKLVGLHVLPVFYDVDPSQVRKQTGSFAEAFLRHEVRFKEERGMVEDWRAALREVADLGGMVLHDGYQSQFIQNIVKEVESKLSCTVIHVAQNLVGIDSRIEPINLWLQNGSNDVGIATIYGMGGVGKTTIAKIVYNMNFTKFEGSSFLANIREKSEQPDGLGDLQRKLLSDLLKRKAKKIYSVDEGIVKIKDIVSCKRVLLILDDVDRLELFTAIIGMKEWFCPGSKIIITTRHEHLLRAHEVNVMYETKGLDNIESLKLFSWHAFHQDHPVHCYKKFSESVVSYCGGLPLALEVLGSSLFGKTVDEWECALQKLERIPDSKLQKILRISYDSLQDDRDKSLFLDIASFFIGKDIEDSVKILDGCNYHSKFGIQNLVDRGLITVSAGNKLMMHQLIREMGREIVAQESYDNPGKRSRLWNDKDVFAVLRENTGTESIRGLCLNLPKLMEDMNTLTIGTTNYAKRHLNESSSDDLLLTEQENCLKRHRLGFFFWKPINNAPKNSLSTKAFSNMQNLKFLQLSNVKLNGSYEDFPKSLVWLRWQGFTLNSIPNDLYMEKLVVLDMRSSNLKYVWKGVKFLGELKILNLSHSHDLIRTPNFMGVPSLERLVLKDCTKLGEVDESIGNLLRLASLNLKDCKSLKKLPVTINMLISLEELILSGCLSLGEFPEDIRRLESLRVLDADGIAINQVVPSKGMKQGGSSLFPSTISAWLLSKRCAQPTSFSLASFPSSLVILSLANCGLSDNAIPKDLSCLPSLEVLNLEGNPIYCIPESVKNLTKLDQLDLGECTRLQSIPELPPSLTKLDVNSCISLERLGVQSEYGYAIMDGCEKLVKATYYFKLEPIRDANKEILNNLGLVNVESLDSIEVKLHNNFTCVTWKTTIQLLYDCGIFSTFIPGSEVPDCFSCQEKANSISFDVLPIVGHKVSGLSLSVIYRGHLLTGIHIFVGIKNKTKGLEWYHIPKIYGVPKTNEDMLWLSYWMVGDQLEDRDQVEISVLCLSPDFHVKGCGIRLIYQHEESGAQSHIRKTVPSWDDRLLDRQQIDYSKYPSGDMIYTWDRYHRKKVLMY